MSARRAEAAAAFSFLDTFLQDPDRSVVFHRADTWVDLTLLDEGVESCIITAPEARIAALGIRKHYCPGYSIELDESGEVLSRERIEE